MRTPGLGACSGSCRMEPMARGTMYQVIDHILVSADHAERLAERFPDSLTQGLWVILEPQETRGIPLPSVGQIVSIKRPDGGTVQLALDGAKANKSGVIALHFRHLSKEAIPRLSRVSWMP